MFPLTIALSRGRIFDETLPLLAAAGIAPEDDPEASRKLILASNRADLRRAERRSERRTRAR